MQDIFLNPQAEWCPLSVVGEGHRKNLRVLVRNWRDSGLEGLLALFFAFVVCTCSGGVVRFEPGDLGRCLLSLGPGGISNIPIVHVVYTAFRHSCGTYGVVKKIHFGFSPANFLHRPNFHGLNCDRFEYSRGVFDRTKKITITGEISEIERSTKKNN